MEAFPKVNARILRGNSQSCSARVLGAGNGAFQHGASQDKGQSVPTAWGCASALQEPAQAPQWMPATM